MAIEINGVPLGTYNANLLDFSVGTPGPDVKYFASPSTLFFKQLRVRQSLRTISLKIEFMAEEEHKVARSISDLTSKLIGDVELMLPDGYYYICMLKKVSAPVRVYEMIYTATFTFIGYRAGREEKHSADLNNSGIPESTSLTVKGNYIAPATITVTAFPDAAISYGSVQYTFDVSSETVICIDGVTKKVTDGYGYNAFKKVDITDFPILPPGKVSIYCLNISHIDVSYRPIYW